MKTWYRFTLIGLIRHLIKCFIMFLGYPVYEYCERCGKRVKLIWRANDELWKRVTGCSEGVLCVYCFNKIAVSDMIYWRASLHSFTGKSNDKNNSIDA